jgi:hypothetical protein
MTKATAQTELLGDGWVVEGQPVWDHSQKSWWTTPSIPQIIASLEEAYQRGHGRSQQAIDFAQQYDADIVFDRYWRPIMDVL